MMTVGDSPTVCKQCGRSLVALKTPHVKRTCDECGKPTYLVEPGSGGKGIQIREGDEFTIPAGSLTVSLDPSKSTGKLFRPGLTWLVTHVLVGGIPSDPEELDGLLDRYEEEADRVLKSSETLAHFDLESEEDSEKAFELISKDRQSIEWWAAWMGGMVRFVREQVDSDEQRRMVLAALQLQASRSMLVFKQRLEDHVWSGYRQALDALASASEDETSYDYDFFISHASEDKDAVARPLAEALQEAGLRVWYDEFALNVGDSLRQKIDEGLARSRFGIVVLSHAFFDKDWPQKELNGLFARETMDTRVILPLWHEISKDEVVKRSPLIADRLALNTATKSVAEIATDLAAEVESSSGS